MTEQIEHDPRRKRPRYWGRELTEQGMPVLLPHPYLESGRINPNSLKRYRRMHQITQGQLAKLLSIGERTVRNVEMGKRYSRRTEEALVYFMLATREIIERYGILPPDWKFDRFFQGEEFDPIRRKEWVNELVSNVDVRVLDLKARIRELEAEVMEKDRLIRELTERRVAKVESMEAAIRKMKADILKLSEHVNTTYSLDSQSSGE